MDRELQDKAWACLPKELRDEVRKEYVRTIAQPVRNIFTGLFNLSNIISEEEPEEVLIVKRSDIISRYQGILARMDPRHFNHSAYLQGQKELLEKLFPTKHIPDNKPKREGWDLSL